MKKNKANLVKAVKGRIGRLFTRAPKVEPPKTVYKRAEKHKGNLKKEE